MEKAKDKDQFIRRVAEELSMGEEVRFDPALSQYGVACREDWFAYMNSCYEEYARHELRHYI